MSSLEHPHNLLFTIYNSTRISILLPLLVIISRRFAQKRAPIFADFQELKFGINVEMNLL
ncbi:hypothetical protein SAMN03080617_02623 [Algoriphagus alkaliphilus]|uniref:Uncharacterized protein n=1 Tax=Algoriphagus alkaliphilus TaxID=279824 RepID=A0A1G5YKQ1_9BACT|nr:hypothetical protein SAMN03080617_02623 [Algoriphagus alkaliphilus]